MCFLSSSVIDYNDINDSKHELDRLLSDVLIKKTLFSFKDHLCERACHVSAVYAEVLSKRGECSICDYNAQMTICSILS